MIIKSDDELDRKDIAAEEPIINLNIKPEHISVNQKKQTLNSDSH